MTLWDDEWYDEWMQHCAEQWARLQLARTLDEHYCATCGAELELIGEELHCKKVCHYCGAKRDCSDP